MTCCANVNSIKMDLEKLAQEKTEMQRHYVMVSARKSPGFSAGKFSKLRVGNKIYSHLLFSYLSFFSYHHNLQYYEMSYGLNVEMHKQVNINI